MIPIEWYLKFRQIRLKIKRHIPIWREKCDDCGKRSDILCEDEFEAYAICPECAGGLLAEMWLGLDGGFTLEPDRSYEALTVEVDKALSEIPESSIVSDILALKKDLDEYEQQHPGEELRWVNKKENDEHDH